jgi:hypothetical protein
MVRHNQQSGFGCAGVSAPVKITAENMCTAGMRKLRSFAKRCGERVQSTLSGSFFACVDTLLSDVNGNYSLAIICSGGRPHSRNRRRCDPDHSGVIQITAARAKS